MQFDSFDSAQVKSIRSVESADTPAHVVEDDANAKEDPAKFHIIIIIKFYSKWRHAQEVQADVVENADTTANEVIIISITNLISSSS